MRRRPLRTAVPEELARFIPQEWPEAGTPRAFAAWCKARIEFADEHPDAALGDVFDVICENRQTRLRLAGFVDPTERTDP